MLLQRDQAVRSDLTAVIMPFCIGGSLKAKPPVMFLQLLLYSCNGRDTFCTNSLLCDGCEGVNESMKSQRFCAHFSGCVLMVFYVILVSFLYVENFHEKCMSVATRSFFVFCRFHFTVALLL